MSENLKPLYIDTETGKLKMGDDANTLIKRFNMGIAPDPAVEKVYFHIGSVSGKVRVIYTDDQRLVVERYEASGLEGISIESVGIIGGGLQLNGVLSNPPVVSYMRLVDGSVYDGKSNLLGGYEMTEQESEIYLYSVSLSSGYSFSFRLKNEKVTDLDKGSISYERYSGGVLEIEGYTLSPDVALQLDRATEECTDAEGVLTTVGECDFDDMAAFVVVSTDATYAELSAAMDERCMIMLYVSVVGTPILVSSSSVLRLLKDDSLAIVFVAATGEVRFYQNGDIQIYV